MEEFLLNNPSPILRIEKGGVILYANQAGKSLLDAWESRVGEKVPAIIRKNVRKAALKKKSEYMEFEAGEKIYSFAFVPSADSKYVILQASDVTFSKEAGKSLSLIDRHYETLSRIAELALKTPDLRILINESLILIAVALDVKYCKILKLLPDGNFLLETGIGWKPEDMGKIIMRNAASTAGYTVLSKKPIQIKELNKKDSIERMGLKGYQEIKSGMSAIIGSIEKPYGVLAVHSTKKERFTKEDAYFLNGAAFLISLALERNEVESTLRDKVLFLETLLDTIPAPVFYKDKEGVYRDCNDLFAKMIFGSSKEKIKGHSIDELSKTIPVDQDSIYRRMYRRMDQQLLQRGGSQVCESRIMCSDGVTRQFLFNKAVYRNLNGAVEGLVGVMLDITGRKRTEENLLKSEERYRLAAEQTGQLIYEFDLKNGHVEWAGAVTELTGYTYNEMQNLNYYDWLEHIHPDERRRVQQEFKKCWNTGKKFDEEFRFRRKDGSYFCVENKGVYLRDEEGCVCKALGVMKDITELKISSEKLKESEELYRSFLQNFKGIAFKLDKDFTPLLMEGAVEEITGYTEEDFTSGRIKLSGLIDPEDMPALKRDREKMNSSPNFIMEHEYRLRKRDGTVKWVHELIHNICSASGETEFIQGYAYDITQKKKAEETLAKAEEIGMREIHHRIKNNLQIVSSLLSLQADKFKDKEVIEAFRESENRVASMSIIHEELHKSEDTTSIDFAVYLRKLTSELLYSYKVGNEKVQLFLDVDHIHLGIDTAIPLGIIINELFSNSLKYAFSKNADGEIRISLCRQPEAPRPGNTPDREADTTDSKTPSGFILVYSDSGGRFPENIDFKNPETLGLQLINALVEQLDGTIVLERGEKTKFTIRFEDKGLSDNG